MRRWPEPSPHAQSLCCSSRSVLQTRGLRGALGNLDKRARVSRSLVFAAHRCTSITGANRLPQVNPARISTTEEGVWITRARASAVSRAPRQQSASDTQTAARSQTDGLRQRASPRCTTCPRRRGAHPKRGARGRRHTRQGRQRLPRRRPERPSAAKCVGAAATAAGWAALSARPRAQGRGVDASPGTYVNSRREPGCSSALVYPSVGPLV